MMVLGVESSTPVASAALVSEEGLVGEITLNTGLTHSEQLLPLIDTLFAQTRKGLDQVEGIAVAGGPGSFTGLRIGMATAKGLAQARNLPLVGVPTLRALASVGAVYPGSLVSPVLNARKGEVYASLVRYQGEKEEVLQPDQAVTPRDWAGILKTYQEPVLFVGDGVLVYRRIWEEELGERAHIPSSLELTARAARVAWLGRKMFLAGIQDDFFALKPIYIRYAEAEKKLLEAGKRWKR